LAGTVRAHRARHGEGDHLLMTFHGIPKSYCDQGDPYARRCELTARALADALGLHEDQWSLSFQSRVGAAEWLKPYTEETLGEVVCRGVRPLDAICTGLAVDCLETVDEIGHEGAETFCAAGGESLHYIPALNADAALVDLITRLVRPLLQDN